MSMIYLAEAHQKGIGGKPDYLKSELWLRRACETGSNYALYKLGRLYLHIEQNARAYEALRAAASNGFSLAQIRLGDMYLQGLGVKRDVHRALRLYEMAATAGNHHGKLRLAVYYLHGPSRRFFSGISQPQQFLKGLRIWFSALCDAIFARPR